MTNCEKFEEVFGFKPEPMSECIIPYGMCPVELRGESVGCNPDDCQYYYFWNKEYETPDSLPFE